MKGDETMSETTAITLIAVVGVAGMVFMSYLFERTVINIIKNVNREDDNK